MKTAEDFRKEFVDADRTKVSIEKAMIEFAKMHIQEIIDECRREREKDFPDIRTIIFNAEEKLKEIV